MSGVSNGGTEQLEMTVYRQGSLNHLPGPNPGTPYTRCGIDAGLMEVRKHPTYAAAVWCSDCLQIAAGMRNAPEAGLR